MAAARRVGGEEEGGAGAGPMDIQRAACGPGVRPTPAPGERLGLR